MSPDVLVTPYGRAGPWLPIALFAGARSVEMLALVDSGAARSVFPLRVAAALGVEHALVEDGVRSIGVEGAGFPTWSYPAGLSAQVMCLRPEDFSHVEPWGESVAMTPAFADVEALLLGREDRAANSIPAHDRL